MSDNLASDIQQAAQPVPNTAIQGVNDAKDPTFNPLTTLNLALGRPNATTTFKSDLKNKNLYSVQAKDWNPVHSTTLDLYEKYEKKYKQRPEETAEQKILEKAKYPDGTFKYYISYTVFKRMMGSDGVEYLVRSGYLHGVSITNLEWKYLKTDFDFHYEPIFDPIVGTETNFFNVKYGDEINQVKKFHTVWDKEIFEKSLRDIPFPKNPTVGITFKVGVEGSLGVVSIPSLAAFRSKSFQDLYEYARTGNSQYLETPKVKK